jgi:hypothetical protein
MLWLWLICGHMSPALLCRNEVLVPFLWATGGNEQLRYRILPLEHFSNVLVLYKRRDAGMPVDNLIVHAGSLHGAEKVSGGVGGSTPHDACCCGMWQLC